MGSDNNGEKKTNDAIPDELVERIAELLESRRKGAAWARSVADSLDLIRRRLHIIFIVAFAIPVSIVMFRIAVMDTDIGGRTPVAAMNAASSEAMMQLAQWTITTVLALGGALIGLNWYQGEKRHEHDRQVFEDRLTANIDKKLSEHNEMYNQHLEMLTRASIASLDAHAARTIRESVGPKDRSVQDLSFVDRVIRSFHAATSVIDRRGAGVVLTQEVISAASTIPGKVGRLEQYQLDRLREIARDLSRDAPDIGQLLETTLNGYEMWHHGQPYAATDEARP